MKCSEFLNELTNYLDGGLVGRSTSELEDHLAWCHNCYVVCDTTRKTIEIYRDSELYELPDDLRTRLRSAIMTKCQEHKKFCPASILAPGPRVLVRVDPHIVNQHLRRERSGSVRRSGPIPTNSQIQNDEVALPGIEWPNRATEAAKVRGRVSFVRLGRVIHVEPHGAR